MVGIKNIEFEKQKGLLLQKVDDIIMGQEIFPKMAHSFGAESQNGS